MSLRAHVLRAVCARRGAVCFRALQASAPGWLAVESPAAPGALLEDFCSRGELSHPRCFCTCGQDNPRARLCPFCSPGVPWGAPWPGCQLRVHRVTVCPLKHKSVVWTSWLISLLGVSSLSPRLWDY